MSIKLLAIRPMNGCDEKFLKNLKKNCIYRFYNEYDYKTNSESFIEYQSKIDTEMEYRNIVNIFKNEEIPNNFYSNNINISAIVGKNGSGKSSLLELLYAYNFNISKKFNLLKIETNYCKIELELYIENNDNSNNIDGTKYYKIHLKSTAKQSSIKIQKSLNNFIFEESTKNIREVALKLYNLTINYSLYGLNSKFNGNWIKNLFHKNDGYKTPIVINPFRNEGIIDVNNEFNLAQSRLVLNHYLIDNKILIDNISLHKVEFILNIKEIQYYKDSNGNLTKNSVKDDLNEFLKKNGFTQFELFISYILGKNIYPKFNDQEIITEIKSIFDINHLCLIYIYKKIRKICYNYEEYSSFQFLFNKEWNNNFFSKHSDRIIKKINSDSIQLNSKELSVFFQKFIRNEMKIFMIDEDLYDKELLTNIGFTKQDTFNEYLIEYKENNKEDPNINQIIHFFLEKADEELDAKRIIIFRNLMINLNKDSSHVTFKLKQAISYFKNNFFENYIDKFEYRKIEENNKIIDDEYIIQFNNDYFQNVDITNIPLAFFKLKISIKNKEVIYDFFRLSSGEQQIIHSLLNIKYHLYNLKSIKQGNRRKYRDINIIFDEVELYFHPEYQRVFISNLINHLKWFDMFKFNIIFATHSPFILSDIPSQNVLKLEEGFPKHDENGINSFGANIHDLLADEFFLGNGFMGEFATEKINTIYKKISELNTNNTSLNLKEFNNYTNEINLIGERVLREPLLNLLDKIMKKTPENREILVKKYKALLKELES